MIECNLKDTDLAAAFGPPLDKRGVFGRFNPPVKVTAPGDVFVLLRSDAAIESGVLKADGSLSPGQQDVILVSKRPHGFAFWFPAVAKDENGHSYDVHVKGQFRVENPKQLLSRLGPQWLAPEAAVTVEALAETVAGELDHCVHDSLQDASPEEEIHKHAHPVAWWQTRLNDWLQAFGLDWSVTKAPEWTSTEADAERLAKERQRARQEREQRDREERQLELAKEETEAEYRRAKTEIDHKEEISALERERELAVLEQKHRQQTREADLGLHRAAWVAEEAELEHQARMAELTGRRELAQRRARLREELADRSRHMQQDQERTLAVLRELIEKLDGHTLAKIGASDPTAAYRIADKLLAPESGLTVGQLRALGGNVVLHEFIAAVHDAAATGTAVKLTMPALQMRTRDVKIQLGSVRKHEQVEVKVLRIGDRLDFALESACGGSVTLLNFGTSGNVGLLVPNSLCPVRSAEIEANQSYAVPGSILLPSFLPKTEQQVDLVEQGPVGREHIVALISREPLMDEAVLRASGCGELCCPLDQDHIDAIAERLASWPRSQWAAAELSFDVVQAHD